MFTTPRLVAVALCAALNFAIGNIAYLVKLPISEHGPPGGIDRLARSPVIKPDGLRAEGPLRRAVPRYRGTAPKNGERGERSHAIEFGVPMFASG